MITAAGVAAAVATFVLMRKVMGTETPIAEHYQVESASLF